MRYQYTTRSTNSQGRPEQTEGRPIRPTQVFDSETQAFVPRAQPRGTRGGRPEQAEGRI